MYPHFQRSRKVDPNTLTGTVASLVAFALMGWVVTSLMWQPLQRSELESVGPELENADAPNADSEGASKAPRSKPRKSTSSRTMTA